jgi:hypothetical protein
MDQTLAGRRERLVPERDGQQKKALLLERCWAGTGTAYVAVQAQEKRGNKLPEKSSSNWLKKLPGSTAGK